MTLLPDVSIFPVIALYVETHFRFLGFLPSLLFRPDPEILFDLPRRLDPGCDLPVLLLVNDIHRFPITLNSIQLAITVPGRPPVVHRIDDLASHNIEHPFSGQSRAILVFVKRNQLPSGIIHINAKVDGIRNGKKFLLLNDNLPLGSGSGYRCLVSDQKLPGSSSCLYGDTHVHSQFSQSHVEFGPPVQVIDAMAHAFGLDFCAVTDHSYDLMCRMDNYLQWDENRERWKAFSSAISNPGSKTVLIAGEEISTLNRRGRVVHLCGFGITDMVDGSLDGARPGRQKRHQPTIAEAAAAIHEQGGIVAAAHPGGRNGILAQLLIRRGIWEKDDIAQTIDGFQAVNGGFGPDWLRAKKQYVQSLLRGLRIPLLAGNDCHGDFNRYRAVGTPLLSVKEDSARFFGNCRTGIYGRPDTAKAIQNALREGKTFVTNGPALGIYLQNGHSVIGSADVELKSSGMLSVVAESSVEFGYLAKIVVWRGAIGSRSESALLTRYYSTEKSFQRTEIIDFSTVKENGYLRAEVLCRLSDGTYSQAYTSPCWFIR